MLLKLEIKEIHQIAVQYVHLLLCLVIIGILNINLLLAFYLGGWLLIIYKDLLISKTLLTSNFSTSSAFL